jgi:hypothetical protein
VVERRRSILRRGRLTVFAVTAFGLIAVAAAGAATGVLSRDDEDAGEVIEGAAPPPPGKDEVVLATGEAPVGGPWRLTAHKSEAIVSDGEEVQPPGLPCLQFLLLAPRKGNFAGSGQCGARDDGFIVQGVPVEDEYGRTEVILWGHAPEQASGIELTGYGSDSIRADTIDGPDGFDGDVWVLPAPTYIKDAQVDWLDSEGNPAGHSREAASIIARGE